jgi:hypothetical protein
LAELVGGEVPPSPFRAIEDGNPRWLFHLKGGQGLRQPGFIGVYDRNE